MKRLRIRKENLIVVAGVVWLVAGVNVAILGVRAAIHMSGAALLVALALAAGSIVIFCAFHAMFSRLVAKNSERIRGLEGERHNPLRFLDARSYATMAVMMSIGFGMRAVGLIPELVRRLLLHGPGPRPRPGRCKLPPASRGRPGLGVPRAPPLSDVQHPPVRHR